MNDEVNREVVTLVFKATKLTADALAEAMQKFQQERNQIKQIKRNEKIRQKVSQVKHGKMKVKDLVKKDAGAVGIEIPHDGVGAFTGIAKKYGVDFAIKKDKTSDPPTYMCFFKAKDTDVVQNAFKEFIQQQEKKREKVPFRQQLENAKKEVAKQTEKAKSRTKNRVKNRNRARENVL